METAGFSHSHNRKKVEDAGCQYYEYLDDLLGEVRHRHHHNPLTPETKDMISARELSLMKPTAC